MENNHWLNLTEASILACCSRKTLYRYMAKGLLPYRKQANNRRYVQRREIEKLFSQNKKRQKNNLQTNVDLTELVNRLEKLSADIEEQSALLKRMISLYKPKTLAELVNKRRR